MARRRVRNRGTVEQLPSGAWRTRVRGTTPQGRKYDFQRTFPTQADAERAQTAFLARALDVEAGLVVIEETLTLSEWRIRAVRQGLKWSRADASYWKHQCRSLWNVPLLSLDAHRLQLWAARLLDTYAGNTVQGCATLVKRLVNAAVRARVLASPPWGTGGLTLVRGRECKRGKEVQPAEWSAVRDAAAALDREGRTDGLWLRLCVQVYTALRPVECCRIAPEWLVATPHGPALDVPLCAVAKGGEEGRKPLPPELADAIARHLEGLSAPARATGLMFPTKGARGRWRSREEKVGRECRGRSWIRASEIKALRERAGVQFTAYQLRHHRLTEVAEKHGPKAAQDLGGHRDGRTTEIYYHKDTRHMAPGMWDSGLLGAPSAPPPDRPDGTDPAARRAGRFMVHDGGKPAPSGTPAHGFTSAAGNPGESRGKAAPTDSLLGAPAPTGVTSAPTPASLGRGRAMGAETLSAADVGPTVEAVRAHGGDAVSRHMLSNLGPAETLSLAADLSAFLDTPNACPPEWSPLLVALVSRLRAHGRRAVVPAMGATDPDFADFA